MQIARKCKSFIEDQGHAVIAMTWRVDDLSLQAKPREEFSALFHPQTDTVIRPDLNIGMVFCLEKFPINDKGAKRDGIT